MEVIKIVEEHLKLFGYDGLYSDNGECACTLDDLAPCCDMKQDCSRGFKHTHSITGDFVISPKKDPMTDNEIRLCIERF